MNQSSLLGYVEACIGEGDWHTRNLTMAQLVESLFSADGRLSHIIRTQEGLSRVGIVCNHYAEDPVSVRYRENELLGVLALNLGTAEGIMLLSSQGLLCFRLLSRRTLEIEVICSDYAFEPWF